MLVHLLVLGLVQGLTEFLPVSSSGHLVAVPFLFGWEMPSLAFTVALHVGTTVALIAYFWRDLVAIVRGVLRAARGSRSEEDLRSARLALMLAVGSIPAAVAGVALGDFFEGQFEDPLLAGVTLAISGVILLVAEWLTQRRRASRNLEEVTVTDAVLIGVLQAVSITPGISRSGATIAGGLGLGLSREAATRFSFLLGVPAFIGAAIVELPDLRGAEDVGATIAATAVAAVVAFASIAYLLRYVRRRTLRPFAAYLFLVAAVVIGYWFQVR